MKDEKTEDLNLDKDWRIGEESFAAIVKSFDSISPKVIVEFGSGASSVRLALRFPDTEIYAIDHDLGYVKECRNFQKKYGVDNLKILHCPLRWQIHNGGVYKSYDQADLPLSIDAVIIDGPPYFVHLGREACFYQVASKIRVGGIVVLDDSSRKIEQRAIANWLEIYPGSLERTDLAVGHGLCVLAKKFDVKPRLSLRYLSRNYRSVAALLKRSIYNWWYTRKGDEG